VLKNIGKPLVFIENKAVICDIKIISKNSDYGSAGKELQWNENEWLFSLIR
jgi:hypothetical protein